MHGWEYKQRDNSEPLTNDELNRHGLDGWELIQVIPRIPSDWTFTYIFKRKIEVD
jgi:hypothetical protein